MAMQSECKQTLKRGATFENIQTFKESVKICA